MNETTTKTLTDMREGLFALARAQRDVIPPPSVTAAMVTEWAVALRKILNEWAEDAERATGSRPDGWDVTVTHEDGHVAKDACSDFDTMNETLSRHAGSEHGDITRIVMV
jgi:hypothetical protein